MHASGLNWGAYNLTNFLFKATVKIFIFNLLLLHVDVIGYPQYLHVTYYFCFCFALLCFYFTFNSSISFHCMINFVLIFCVSSFTDSGVSTVF